MKWWNFKYSILVAIFMTVSSLSAYALETADTIVIINNENIDISRYDKRINRYNNFFASLVPKHNKIQFYGGIGLVSVGAGWDYGKNRQWETDILLGIIPKYNSNSTKASLTLKQTYLPWKIDLGKGFSVQPLSCGLYMNTILSNKFWTRSPSRYPDNYYTFSTRIRFHIFLGQVYTFDIPQKRRFFIKSISAFYEISSCDLYIVSAFTNKSLKPSDYLRLSFGLKFQIL